jgi:DNA polymerase I-like protein with 3'-5' exonuclease and polymerase domains
LYGQGSKGLAVELGIEESDAAEFLSAFKARFPDVFRFIASVAVQCRKRGYVQTLLGRRRNLPRISSTDEGERTQAERQAVNTVHQGSAADIIKLAMISIQQQLNQFEADEAVLLIPQLETSQELAAAVASTQRQPSARLVLQLHDELIYEVRDSYFEQIKVQPFATAGLACF